MKPKEQNPAPASDDDEGAVAGYLGRFVEDLRGGKARWEPPPGRAAGSDEIYDAVRAARESSTSAGERQRRLFKVAVEADATGFEPWEEPLRFRTGKLATMARRWPWIAAAAASVGLFVGLGSWQWAPRSRIQEMEASFQLHVGYGDFDLERGHPSLRAGTSGKIVFSLHRRCFYSVIVLEPDFGLSIEIANAAGEARRYEANWELPERVFGDGRETVFVVAGLDPWQDLNEFVDEATSDLNGARDERIRKIVEDIHERFGLAVAHETYTIAPPSGTHP